MNRTSQEKWQSQTQRRFACAFADARLAQAWGLGFSVSKNSLASKQRNSFQLQLFKPEHSWEFFAFLSRLPSPKRAFQGPFWSEENDWLELLLASMSWTLSSSEVRELCQQLQLSTAMRDLGWLWVGRMSQLFMDVWLVVYVYNCIYCIYIYICVCVYEVWILGRWFWDVWVNGVVFLVEHWVLCIYTVYECVDIAFTCFYKQILY